MSEPQAKPRRRVIRNVLLALLAAFLLATLALVWYVNTESFHNMVHRRLVSALERMTGGRVELGKFTVVPLRFRIEVHDLTIHGTEAPGEIPYAHVDDLLAEIKVISIFEAEYGFSSLTLEHPVVHIIVDPDGSTNQPRPRTNRASRQNPVEQLFSLSIKRLQVVRGELLWDNQRIPLEFAAGDVSAGLDYSILRRRYEGYLRAGKVDTKFRDFRPFTSLVEAEFGLGESYIEVRSLGWSSGRSHLEASGRVDDLRKPKFAVTYNTRIDLADFGSVARISELRGGTLEIGGKGTYSAEDFQTAGKLLLKDFEWRDNSVAVRNAGLSAQYSLSPASLKVSDVQARLLGGSATGNLEVANWLNSTAFSIGAKRPAEQKGSLTLRLKDLSVAALASVFTTRKLPLDRLKLTGSATGIVEANWRGSPKNAEDSFRFDVVPESRVAAGQIPLTARAVGVYRGSSEELELPDLYLATAGTQIRASGKLSSSASLRLSAITTDLAEWQPILTAFGGPQIPITLGGRATFNGTATGSTSDITVAGRLQMFDFTTILPGAAGRHGQQVHWDSLVADLQISPRMLSARNGMLVHGPSTTAFDVSATLHDGQLTPTSPFTARIHVRNAELAEFKALAGFDFPGSGQTDVVLSVSGTRLDPHGEGQIQVVEGDFYGRKVSTFGADLRFAGGEAQLNNIAVVYNDARIMGNVAYNPQTRAFRCNLSGTDFDLARFPRLQKARVAVGGRLDFTAQGAGTLDEPVINASIHLRGLTFDKERAGDFTFDAVTHGADLQLTGRSSFEKAQLSIDGTVHMRGDWPADLSLRFTDLDVDPLLSAYLESWNARRSAVAGGLQLHGPLLQPRELGATADLSRLSLDVENIHLQNQGPIQFTVAGQVLTLNQLRLVGEGTDLSAHGSAQLSDERELDLRAEGRLSLKVLEAFSPDLTASGVVNAAVTVGGTYSNPVLAGKVEVSEGSVASTNLPNGLSDLNGTLAFSQNRLQIQALTAHVGGGTVNLTGFVAYSPHLNFDITARSQDVRLRPGGISATANADLHLVGTSNEASLSGDVTVAKLNLAPNFDFARYLEGMKQTTSMPQANSILNKVRLDVHVVTTPELQMQTSLAKISGDADLHLRGTLIRPTVLGRVDITEGDVYFSGTKYRLERGEITFTGPAGIKPTLDLQATTRVRDYDINLGVNGTPEKPNFTYRSEPPLPSADIVALLALGRTQSESAAMSSSASSSQSAFSQEASNVILNQALNATLNNRAQRLFGISRIKIDPQGLNTLTTPTRTAPAITIEQQVSNNFTLTYSTEVSQATQQIIQAEYNVTRSISILAVRDQNGVVSFDIRLRQRRK